MRIKTHKVAYACANTEYERYADKQNIDFTRRREIKGEYKTSIGQYSETFSCINIDDDAQKSYKFSLEFFNTTKRKGDEERIFVSAKWVL